jgi:hypothetical protein
MNEMNDSQALFLVLSVVVLMVSFLLYLWAITPGPSIDPIGLPDSITKRKRRKK